ncbi:sensor histidine kinase [Streptomyces iconiensis]|uniref:histidine kinase n=1 Tax=Streptomyces iconiensis TaxID=1384038 RepID=A0ABT6ZNN3_9ACTN|nr:histidine kinase [Streptomyces iconiensis]MDJ1130669.1 histidine kinase [Streptomyces iconiensis]
MRTTLHRWSWAVLGLLLGTVSALGACLLLLVAAVWRRARTGARPLVEMERRRIAAFYGTRLGPVPRESRRAMAYLALRLGPALLGAAVLVATVAGAVSASFLVWGWFVLARLDNPVDVLLSACGGLFLLFLALQGVYGVALVEVHLGRRWLGPSGREVLERRIGELAATRAGVVEAVHEERRRIERDLHDGVQQRLVALALLLARARRASGTPEPAEKSEALLRQAHEESQEALSELRDVAWRVYPASLDNGGLGAALETLTERLGTAALVLDLTVDLAAEPPPTVRTVAYFVAAEAVTNAVKHAHASRIALRVTSPERGTVVTVTIEDDGHGGADGTGTGLLGLSRRVAALDGRLALSSPVGGPTRVTAELPCG